MKNEAAKHALSYITSEIIIGVGTGSTVNCLIDCLHQVKNYIKATVAKGGLSGGRY